MNDSLVICEEGKTTKYLSQSQTGVWWSFMKRIVARTAVHDVILLNLMSLSVATKRFQQTRDVI